MRRSIDQPETVNATVFSNDQTGLEKFTNYCVYAVAFNSMGIGNQTDTVCISTDEDGML